MKLRCLPRYRKRESMASRVVPASGATTWRSSPSSRLTSEDFPALGRPTTATVDRSPRLPPDRRAAAARPPRRAGRRFPSRSRRSRPTGRRSRAGRNRTAPCCARDRRACSPRARTGRRALRSRSAIAWSTGLHALAPVDHEQHDVRLPSSANSTCCRMARSIESSDSGTRPPVSTTQKWRPCHSASPKWRSRVVPGRSETMAGRPPRMRLNRVDLPTLGRPTMATVGLLTRPPAGAARR